MPIEEHGFIEKLSEGRFAIRSEVRTFQWYL
jgi:hypothetical protein